MSDDFRGGRIDFAGIKFGHQQQEIFWQAVDRYLNRTIHCHVQKMGTRNFLIPYRDEKILPRGHRKVTWTFYRHDRK